MAHEKEKFFLKKELGQKDAGDIGIYCKKCKIELYWSELPRSLPNAYQYRYFGWMPWFWSVLIGTDRHWAIIQGVLIDVHVHCLFSSPRYWWWSYIIPWGYQLIRSSFKLNGHTEASVSQSYQFLLLFSFHIPKGGSEIVSFLLYYNIPSSNFISLSLLAVC